MCSSKAFRHVSILFGFFDDPVMYACIAHKYGIVLSFKSVAYEEYIDGGLELIFLFKNYVVFKRVVNAFRNSPPCKERLDS